MKIFIINQILFNGLICKIKKLKDFYKMYCKYCKEVDKLATSEIKKQENKQ